MHKNTFRVLWLRGTYLGKITFQDVNAPLRTDTSFRNKLQQTHHTGDSPLLALDIDMASQSVVDYMHLVCLGVMRKLLYKTWLIGPRHTRISQGQSALISQRLSTMRSSTPVDFQRKPRANFKATEYRQFLLYTGPLVLYDILPKVMYEHFLTLHVAIRILVSHLAYDLSYVDYAHELLVLFVERYKILYGPEWITFNVHGLLHLANDVKLYGPLDNFSAFKFESLLGQLKFRVKSPSNPLQQIVNRSIEMMKLTLGEFICTSNDQSHDLKLSNIHFDGPLGARVTGTQYKKLRLRSTTITNHPPDNCVIMKDDTFICVRNIVQTKKSILIIGCPFLSQSPLYNYPCSSTKLNIYVVRELGNIGTFKLSDMKCKCVNYAYKGNTSVVMPLLYSVHMKQ